MAAGSGGVKFICRKFSAGRHPSAEVSRSITGVQRTSVAVKATRISRYSGEPLASSRSSITPGFGPREPCEAPTILEAAATVVCNAAGAIWISAVQHPLSATVIASAKVPIAVRHKLDIATKSSTGDHLIVGNKY